MRSALDLRRPRRRHLTPRESHCPTLWCRCRGEQRSHVGGEEGAGADAARAAPLPGPLLDEAHVSESAKAAPSDLCRQHAPAPAQPASQPSRASALWPCVFCMGNSAAGGPAASGSPVRRGCSTSSSCAATTCCGSRSSTAPRGVLTACVPRCLGRSLPRSRTPTDECRSFSSVASASAAGSPAAP